MGIFKKIWYWLSQDVTKGFQKSDEEFMLKSTTYNTGGYIGGVKEYVEAGKRDLPKYALRGYISKMHKDMLHQGIIVE